MLTSSTLQQQLIHFLNSIHDRKTVNLEGLCNEDLVELVPYLLRHKLENIAFISHDQTKSMFSFYEETWDLLYHTILNNIKEELSTSGAIFLQGFPRVMDFKMFMSPGMRVDIDIFVPEENLESFRNNLKKKGFNNYGYTDNEIVLVDDNIIQETTLTYWATKDFTLTYPLESILPENLPVDFGDIYLPWIYRDNKWHVLISIELHHKYTDVSDPDVIQKHAEPWPGTPFLRSDIASLIFFNLIRLYKGVLAGELRIRILLDTACLFTDENIESSLEGTKDLIEQSSLNSEIKSLCAALVEMHDVFYPLQCIIPSNINNSVKNEWFNAFYNSLNLGLNK